MGAEAKDQRISTAPGATSSELIEELKEECNMTAKKWAIERDALEGWRWEVGITTKNKAALLRKDTTVLRFAFSGGAAGDIIKIDSSWR